MQMIRISAHLDEGETTFEALYKRKVVYWISHWESALYGQSLLRISFMP